MDLLSVVVLLSAALTVGLIALCYADLASHFTGSGAAWLYSYNAFVDLQAMSLVYLHGFWAVVLMMLK